MSSCKVFRFLVCSPKKEKKKENCDSRLNDAKVGAMAADAGTVFQAGNFRCREREGGGVGGGGGGFKNNGASGEISDQTPMRRCVDPHTGQDSAGAGLAYS